jgi:tRNA pseudouridine55 synthase
MRHAAMTDVFEGVLPVDKPAGPTSHDVVARARRALRMRRIGHTGTLDPFATGLLLLCLGRATRIAEYLTGFDKRYTARVRLGISTDTHDDTGQVTAAAELTGLTCDAVDYALEQQRGPIMQLPPQYSAKKSGGERAYDVARAGGALTLAPVHVDIHELRITACELPFVDIDVHCSSGTYIRAIARDLGDTLGVGAHLVALRRTAIGDITLAQALHLEQLDDPQQVAAALVSSLAALGSLSRVNVSESDVEHLRHGRRVETDADVAGTVAIAANDELIAIGDAHDHVIRPRKVFL